MRDDQFERLEQLQEKLCESVFDEADPDNWPGKDKLPMEMSKDERGDRYWCKKNAAATLTLLTKTLSLAHFKESPDIPAPGSQSSPEDDFEKEIKKAERDAAKQLEKFEKKKRLKVVR
jgi:hypothetical protein